MSSPSTSRILWASLGVFLLALAVRWPHLSQGLWFDEMVTLVDYVLQPWQHVVAAQPGDYVPNNHVLHTVLAKLTYSLGPHNENGGTGPNEPLLRVPALLASCLLPIALAWPLRKSRPIIALVIALLAAMHPWLVAFGTEARGYSMMLLFGVIATNLLPDGQRGRWPIGYALALAAAIYTLPIAVLLIVAHGVAAVLRLPLRSDPSTQQGRDRGFGIWLRGAIMAVVLSALLYAPMARAMMQYFRNPFEPTISYREFLDHLPRYALAGERLPRHPGPAPTVDPPAASVYWALPVLAIVIGSIFAWPIEPLRPLLVTLAVTSVCGIVLAGVRPAACEVRFVAWAGLWLIVAVTAILVSPTHRWSKGVAVGAIGLLLVWMGMCDVRMPPNEPVREAMARADALAPPDHAIVIGSLGAREAAYLYGYEIAHHDMTTGHNMPLLLAAEQRVIDATGHKPWIVMLYEDLARRRDRRDQQDIRGMWTHLMKNYYLKQRLPGRVAPVAIYAPRETRADVAAAPNQPLAASQTNHAAMAESVKR